MDRNITKNSPLFSSECIFTTLFCKFGLICFRFPYKDRRKMTHQFTSKHRGYEFIVNQHTYWQKLLGSSALNLKALKRNICFSREQECFFSLHIFDGVQLRPARNESLRSVCSFMRFTNSGNLNVLFAISLVGVTDLGKCNRRFFFLEYSEESYCIFMSSYWGLREVLCLVFTWGNGNTKNWSYASELFVDPFTCLEILDDHRGKLVIQLKKRFASSTKVILHHILVARGCNYYGG